jgi:hypothetical protein
MFVIKQIVVHVGLTERQKLLMTECVLLQVANSKLFYLLQILPPAVMVLIASHLVAMVVKLLPHGTGSRKLVLYLEETLVMVHFVLIILCQSVLTMSL